MPYDGLKTQYPLLERNRWLTPVFQVARWFRIFTGGRLHQAIQEYKIGESHSKIKIDEMKTFLINIGLDFK